MHPPFVMIVALGRCNCLLFGVKHLLIQLWQRYCQMFAKRKRKTTISVPHHPHKSPRYHHHHPIHLKLRPRTPSFLMIVALGRCKCLLVCLKTKQMVTSFSVVKHCPSNVFSDSGRKYAYILNYSLYYILYKTSIECVHYTH